MANTTLTKYVIASLSIVFFFTFFSIILNQLGNIYDLSDVNDSYFESYNFTETAEFINNTGQDVSNAAQGDESLFDVIGGIFLKAIAPLKTVWAGIQLFTTSTASIITTLLGDELGNLVIKFMIGVISITITMYVLIKFIGKADNKLD